MKTLNLTLKNMDKIPTAEEWLSNHNELSMYDVVDFDEGGYNGVDERKLYKIMFEFTAIYVRHYIV